MLTQIYTFGYGNRTSYDQLSSYFQEHSIGALIDIRKSPKAWTRKWWKDKLEEFCQSCNVQYLSAPELGNISGKANWIPPDKEKLTIKLIAYSKLMRIMLFFCVPN